MKHSSKWLKHSKKNYPRSLMNEDRDARYTRSLDSNGLFRAMSTSTRSSFSLRAAAVTYVLATRCVGQKLGDAVEKLLADQLIVGTQSGRLIGGDLVCVKVAFEVFFTVVLAWPCVVFGAGHWTATGLMWLC